MAPIYLDHAATTPVDARVLEAMLPFLREHYGNASSVHSLGRKARYAVESCRERVAACLGAQPSEILFTSGGTESDNTALMGMFADADKCLITSSAEHEAILKSASRLKESGRCVRMLQPGPTGSVNSNQVREAISGDTGLVSLMHVNNEVGAISDVEEIAGICNERGVLFHCDAVQSVGMLPLDMGELAIDALSISGHKIYGPKGIGVLFVRGGSTIHPLVVGGAQERGRRAGTENVAGIVGIATALELVLLEREERYAHVHALRERLYRHLCDALDNKCIINTSMEDGTSSPHILSIAFSPQDGAKIDGEMLLLNLDMEGICVSSGSACTSGAVEPSHVLLAMGIPQDTASASVRFSLGKDNTMAEIDYVVIILKKIIDRMTQKTQRKLVGD